MKDWLGLNIQWLLKTFVRLGHGRLHFKKKRKNKKACHGKQSSLLGHSSITTIKGFITLAKGHVGSKELLYEIKALIS
jgi:hypothetical protein